MSSAQPRHFYSHLMIQSLRMTPDFPFLHMHKSICYCLGGQMNCPDNVGITVFCVGLLLEKVELVGFESMDY